MNRTTPLELCTQSSFLVRPGTSTPLGGTSTPLGGASSSFLGQSWAAVEIYCRGVEVLLVGCKSLMDALEVL